MVGAFLAGAVMEAAGSTRSSMDQLRHNILLVVMPVFFLSTGLRTNWDVGGQAVFAVAGCCSSRPSSGKLIGAHIAGAILKWRRARPRSSAGCCRPRR